MKAILIMSLLLFSNVSLAEPMTPMVEPLLGAVTRVEGVYIQVPSKGCTRKESFRVQKEKIGNVTSVTFIRVDYDPCLAFVLYGDIFGYSYEELGLHRGDRFIIANPMTFSTVR